MWFVLVCVVWWFVCGVLIVWFLFVGVWFCSCCLYLVWWDLLDVWLWCCICCWGVVLLCCGWLWSWGSVVGFGSLLCGRYGGLCWVCVGCCCCWVDIMDFWLNFVWSICWGWYGWVLWCVWCCVVLEMCWSGFVDGCFWLGMRWSLVLFVLVVGIVLSSMCCCMSLLWLYGLWLCVFLCCVCVFFW